MIQRETSVSARRRSTPPDRSAGPVRTCVGCRRRQLAAELLRVVAVSKDEGNAIVVDTAGTLPGRGAWLHPDSQCLGVAVQRRAFGRALRITGLPDTSEAAEHIAELHARQQNR